MKILLLKNIKNNKSLKKNMVVTALVNGGVFIDVGNEKVKLSKLKIGEFRIEDICCKVHFNEKNIKYPEGYYVIVQNAWREIVISSPLFNTESEANEWAYNKYKEHKEIMDKFNEK